MELIVVPDYASLSQKAAQLTCDLIAQDCAGLRFRGHQFRYSELRLTGEVDHVYTVRRRRGGEVTREGYRVGATLASYVHAHWASNPSIAAHFADACRA